MVLFEDFMKIVVAATTSAFYHIVLIKRAHFNTAISRRIFSLRTITGDTDIALRLYDSSLMEIAKYYYPYGGEYTASKIADIGKIVAKRIIEET
jgi:hypothetical protein